MLKPIALLSLFLATIVGCKFDEQKQSAPIPKEKIAMETKKIVEPEIVKINYELVALSDTINWIEQLGEDSLFTLLVLNRIDKGHFRSLDSVLVPDVFHEDINVYCPFPVQVDSLNEINKIIFVSRYAQIFAAYENGKRVKWGPTSTGKEVTQTTAGLFSTNWKRKRNISSVNSSWILNWSFNISNDDGISFHEYDLPGKPASHSCVRLYAKDSEWIYYWAEQWILDEEHQIAALGTPVIIFGDYPYDSRRPWWNLAENKKCLTISTSELFNETRPFYAKIIERQKVLIWEQKKKISTPSTT